MNHILNVGKFEEAMRGILPSQKVPDLV